jgi:hypothetical protein
LLRAELFKVLIEGNVTVPAVPTAVVNSKQLFDTHWPFDLSTIVGLVQPAPKQDNAPFLALSPLSSTMYILLEGIASKDQ